MHVIGKEAFAGCNAQSIVLPSMLNHIGDMAFTYNCITEIIIPAEVYTVGEDIFKNCDSLKTVSFADDAFLIADNLLKGCVSLEYVNVPSSIESIGKSVFNGCENLKEVKYDGTKEEWNEIEKEDGWDNGAPSFTVIYKDGSSDRYGKQ